VKISVRLAPRGRADKIAGVVAGADGKPALKVTVTAPPEKGRANAALIALLAKAWRLPKTSLTVAAGTASRNKTVAIAGDADALMQRLTEWAGTLDG